MSRWEDDLVDEFVSELSEADDDLVWALLDGEEVTPTPASRDALLASARLEGRFDRFVSRVAALADVSDARAAELLDGIGREDVWSDAPVPGVRAYHFEGGPRVAGAITGFVRMPEGTVFPPHTHLGDEAVLIIQGSLEDASGRVHRAGEVVRMAAGTTHHFSARPGPSLVYLVVLAKGLQIGETVLGPDDPRM